jgi:streptomycin 6-kinase
MLNERFVRNIVALSGKAGQEWLDSIPKRLKVYEAKWALKILEPFALSYNYVTSAERADGTPVVLKLGFPEDAEFNSEVAALKLFDGNGAIQLLEEDVEHNAVLLERVMPGLQLSQLDDEQATQIAAQVAKRLWKPAVKSESLIPLERWFRGFEWLRQHFNGGTGPLPESIVEKGEKLFAELLRTTTTPMLIHGDFHHFNILYSERNGWVTIDPKGVIGDPLYDLSVFLYNPIPTLLEQRDVRQILKRRIEIFSQALDAKPERIIQWGIAQAVLSAIWTVQDNGGDGWNHTITCAQLLLEL